jgi:hypothetical protein
MRRIAMMLVMTAVPLLQTSAQAPQQPKPPVPGGGAAQRPNLPDLERKAELKAEMKAELNSEPAGEPSAELNVSEFQLKRNDLKGRVVELTFDKVVSLKQAGKEGYLAMVTYESPRLQEGLTLVVPSEGLEFFEDLSKPEIRRKESVYVQVLNPFTVKALGTRYRKDKPEGERYSW